MELANDKPVILQPDQNFFDGSRTIEVDVKDEINFVRFSLQENFEFNPWAFNRVSLDQATKSRLIISINKSIKLGNIADELFVRYFAKSQNGSTVTGRVTFPEEEFEIGAAPIILDLENNCSLPDKIIINVRDYNNGFAISLTDVGDNNVDAGTVTLTDQEGSDYNDDYNDDFGMEPSQIITYTLNKATDFWKTMPAQDRFEYFISYKGKTASNFITIKLKC